MKALLEKIREILRNRRTRQMLTRFVSCTSAVVVFVVTYALVLPAITVEQNAPCGIEEHQHTDSCYEDVLVCGIPEGKGHHHDASCYEKFLICGKEVHVHSLECYQQGGSALISSGNGVAASTALADSGESVLYGTDGSGYDSDALLTDENAAGEESMEGAAAEESALGQSAAEETGTEKTDAKETAGGQASPEGYETGQTGPGETVPDGFDSDTLNPEIPEGWSSEEGNTEASAYGGTASEDSASAASTAASIPSDKAAPAGEMGAAQGISFKAGMLTVEGDGYKITLDYTEKAEIPANAELSVREITAETDSEAYEACLEQAGAQVAADEKTSVDRKASRFFDIEIITRGTDSEGNEEIIKIEPAAPVSVNIQIIDNQTAENDTASVDQKTGQSEPAVLHFSEEGVEQLDAEVRKGVEQLDAEVKESQIQEQKGDKDKGTDEQPEPAVPATEISFEAESFSIYAVVYTVDFHWEVDGKTYDFSIPGGGFVSLEHVVEILGIASADENTNNRAENAENSAESGDDFAGEVLGVDTSDENGEGSANATADGEISPSTDSTTYEEAIKLNDVEVSEAAKKFVTDVERAEFSKPELVWVGKVDEATTAGGIKESRGLEVEYSAELTEEQIAEINAQKVEAGDWALISMQPFTSEEILTVTMKNGDQFVIRVTDYQISTNVLTVDGKTYKITVTFDDDAEIPAGTRLVAEEIGQNTDEYMQYLGQTWIEVNKAYLERLLSKSPGEYCDIPQVSIDQARFFNITLMLGDREIEPKTPVQVEISYVNGLGIDGFKEHITGVSHFKDGENEPIRDIEPEKLEKPEEPEAEEGRIEVYFNDGSVELIDDVKTSTDEEGRLTEYRYEQDSFSVVGTYIGHETRNAVMRVPQMRLSGTGGGSLVTPDPQKHLDPNKKNGVEDGTYTLSLSVTGDSKESTQVETKKSNVLFIMDRSSSMNRYVRYLGTIDTSSTNYYGSTDNGRTVFPVLYQNGKWQYQQRVGWSYQWVDYNAEQYGFYIDDARLPQEQAALKNLFQQLLAKNEINDENSDDDNVEIKVISFATKAGKNQGWSGTESGWVDGTSSTALNTAVNNDSTASGTNWEEALKYAQSEMDAKKAIDGDDEDYYIVFLTDGGPTATTWSVSSSGANYNGAYYGTEGHSASDQDGHVPPRPRNSCEPAYEDASDDARALVDAGYKLYNIFTYGTNEDYKYMVRLTNYAYRETEYIYDDVHDNLEPTDYDPESAAATKYFTNATDTEKLVEAFQNIFSEISVTQAYAQVKITDGLRQDALTSTFTNGKPSGVTYTVSPKDSPNTPLYTVTATVPENSDEPIVTFKIGDNEYSTENNQVVKHVKEPVENDPLASYDAGTYYSVTVDKVEYKMALASVVPTDNQNVSTLIWDLTPIGMLLDDCVYEADFIVWPNQDAYDYVAALNNRVEQITNSENELVDVVWNQSEATAVTDNEQKEYYQGGCTAYPSIVYYPGTGDDYENGIYNGTFAVLTNTEQKLDYSVVTTEDGEVTSVVPQTPIDMELPDPMELTAVGSRVSKRWNVNRDPDALLRLLYEFDDDMPRVDENGQPVPKQYEYIIIDEETGQPVIDEQTGEPKKGISRGFFIEFKVLQDTDDLTRPAYNTVRLGWDDNYGENGGYVWYEGTGEGEGAPFVRTKTYGQGDDQVTLTYGTRWEQDFSIATGLMLTYDQMIENNLNPSDYPHGKYPNEEGGEIYYLLEDGHDYMLGEPELGYVYDFSSPKYHPMLVDGVMKSVLYTKNADNTISISEIGDMELATDDGPPLLNVINTMRGYIHVDKDVVDASGTALSDDETKFTYEVILYNGDGAFTIDGNHIPWYGISGLYYHSKDENEEYYYYQAKATGTEIIDGVKIGHLSLTDEDGNTFTATCEGEFDEHTAGPTTITFDESGEEIELYGNQMDYQEEDAIEGLDGTYRKVSVTFMITQDQQLSIANIPVSTTYRITESSESGYAFVKIDANVSGIRKENTTVSGTIVPDSDTNIIYTNRCLVTDISIQKVEPNGAGLKGAVFQLKKVSDEGHEEVLATTIDTIGGIGNIVKDVDGDSKTFPSSFESTGDIQTLTGLPDGVYRLYEVYVPEGYISTYRYIQFTIENRVMKDVTTDTEDTSKLDTTANNIDLVITNTPGAALPNSGGPGTNIIYLLGITLLSLAGAGIVMKRRRRRYAA